MSDHTIKERIKNLFISVLDLEIKSSELSSDGLITKYGLNSVDALELLMNIENEFDVEIDEEDLTSELVDSIDHLVEYVKARQDA